MQHTIIIWKNNNSSEIRRNMPTELTRPEKLGARARKRWQQQMYMVLTPLLAQPMLFQKVMIVKRSTYPMKKWVKRTENNGWKKGATKMMDYEMKAGHCQYSGKHGAWPIWWIRIMLWNSFIWCIIIFEKRISRVKIILRKGEKTMESSSVVLNFDLGEWIWIGSEFEAVVAIGG